MTKVTDKLKVGDEVKLSLLVQHEDPEIDSPVLVLSEHPFYNMRGIANRLYVVGLRNYTTAILKFRIEGIIEHDSNKSFILQRMEALNNEMKDPEFLSGERFLLTASTIDRLLTKPLGGISG